MMTMIIMRTMKSTIIMTMLVDYHLSGSFGLHGHWNHHLPSNAEAHHLKVAAEHLFISNISVLLESSHPSTTKSNEKRTEKKDLNSLHGDSPRVALFLEHPQDLVSHTLSG